MIYLDYTASTPVNSEVLKSYIEVTQNYYGNANSLHEFGVFSRRLLNQAKTQILNMLNLPESDYEVIMTGTATEANYLLIRGIALAYKKRGNHIITSVAEHASVLKVFKQLENEGFEVSYIGVDKSGCLNYDELENAITDKTILVSLMHVNNVVGSINNLAKIKKIVNAKSDAIIHTDSVQSVCKQSLELELINVDCCTISGHKLYAPKGIGALIKRKSIKMTPFIVGGGQENGYRGGTTHVAGAVALAKAMRIASEKTKERFEYVSELSDYLHQSLSELEGVEVVTDKQNSVPNIVSFSVVGKNTEIVINSLSKEKIFVSARSACSSRSKSKVTIIDAMGYDEAISSSGIRVSISHLTTKEELQVFVDKLKQVINELV